MRNDLDIIDVILSFRITHPNHVIPASGADGTQDGNKTVDGVHTADTENNLFIPPHISHLHLYIYFFPVSFIKYPLRNFLKGSSHQLSLVGVLLQDFRHRKSLDYSKSPGFILANCEIDKNVVYLLPSLQRDENNDHMKNT